MKTVTHILIWCFGIAALLVASALIGHQFSPWPSALAFRAVMDGYGTFTSIALSKHVPYDVKSKLDLPYTGDPGAVLDVHYPLNVDRTDRKLTTIVWVHGGGYISGSKSQVANYLKVLAGHGYTVIGINYGLAPGHRYPNPVWQTNHALNTLSREARGWNVDINRVVLAGDSAGAQIAAQMAMIISSPAYAKAMKVDPNISRPQLIGAILHCGIYDFSLLDLDGSNSTFLRTAGWSYFGTRDFASLPAIRRASVIDHVTAELPPLFISAGNADPLLPHSLALADKATKQGAKVDALFFPKDNTPALGHEYQFNLDTDAGKLALNRTLKFLAGLKQ